MSSVDGMDGKFEEGLTLVDVNGRDGKLEDAVTSDDALHSLDYSTAPICIDLGLLDREKRENQLQSPTMLRYQSTCGSNTCSTMSLGIGILQPNNKLRKCQNGFNATCSGGGRETSSDHSFDICIVCTLL
jgi:hypothetical protein